MSPSTRSKPASASSPETGRDKTAGRGGDGKRETVEIELEPGRHVLELRVDGVAPNGKQRTDRDHLAFVVR